MEKLQKPLDLFHTQAVYAPTFVPPMVAKDLNWGRERFRQLRSQGVAARLLHPSNQGPVVVFHQAALVS